MISKNAISVRFAGAAGDGIQSAGYIFAKTCVRSGLHCFGHNTYQSLIRGGHVWFHVSASCRRIAAFKDCIDLLVLLRKTELRLHQGKISPGGIVLYDKAAAQPSDIAIENCIYIPMPFIEIASKLDRNPILQNAVALGAVSRLTNLKLETLHCVISETLTGKKDLIKTNVEAATAGYLEIDRDNSIPEWKLETGKSRRLLMTGNEAIALGAVAADCKFYAAYPMTPASSIQQWLAEHSKKTGIIVKQAEDELAAINMAIGASHVGVRAMTGTSGAGFALMSEAFGFAGMTETPLVVVECQRGGPSTGLPTKTEQGDLNMILHASQGDFPRIIIAPKNVEDCYKATIEAFNLADRYQLPVVILSDLSLADRYETIDSIDTHVSIDRGLLARDSGERPFRRYALTEDGISPRAIPGQPNMMFLTVGEEHDEHGGLITGTMAGTPEYHRLRKAMMDKRMRKLHLALRDLQPPTIEGPVKSDITLIGWGSTYGAIGEAARILSTERAIATNHIHFQTLWPFHATATIELLSRCNSPVLIENNYTGQLGRLIRSETGFEITKKYLKFDGEPITPLDIVTYIESVMAN